MLNKKNTSGIIGLGYVGLPAQDCIIVATDHSSIDYSWVLEHSSMVVDTRNVFKGYHSVKIFKA